MFPSLMLSSSITVNERRLSQGTLKHTVLSRGCNAWYNNGSVVIAMYPVDILHFKGNLLFHIATVMHC